MVIDVFVCEKGCGYASTDGDEISHHNRCGGGLETKQFVSVADRPHLKAVAELAMRERDRRFANPLHLEYSPGAVIDLVDAVVDAVLNAMECHRDS